MATNQSENIQIEQGFVRCGESLIPLPLGSNTAALAALAAKVEAALPKAGGEMTGDINFRPAPDTKPNFNVAVYDDDNLRVAAFRGGIREDDSRYSSLICFDHEGIYRTAITANIEKHDDSYTVYATCPPARGLFNNDIATMQDVINYAPRKLTENIYIHVNANTGSDTADLNNGRGLSVEKPFKTPQAAISWACSHYTSINNIIIQLDSDISLSSSLFIAAPNVKYVILRGATAETKLNIASGCKIELDAGGLYLENITINGNSAVSALICTGFTHSSHIWIGQNVTITGSYSNAVFIADYGGRIFIRYAISGSATGKRYTASYVSAITSHGLGPNAIPGTEPGTCDATSVYA